MNIQGSGFSSGSSASGNTQVLSYDEWLKQPENLHYLTIAGGSGGKKEYQDYLKSFAATSAANAAEAMNGFDVTGYSQSSWDLNKTRELLEEQRAFNSAEAAKARDWEEYMSNTAVQRQVKDLEAAGLNKWLALNGGAVNGASTPSAVAASSSAGDASTPNPAIYIAIIKALASVMNSALKII